MKPSPSDIDMQIGRNLKRKRVASGLTLQALADILGVSFQQVQKYERGQNRLSASNLFLISESLDVKIEEFFENIIQDSSQLQEDVADFEYLENVSDHEITNLVKSYSMIQDKEVRKKILSLTNTLQSSQEA